MFKTKIMTEILLIYFIISTPIYCVNQKPNTLKTSDNSFFWTLKDFLHTSVEYISSNPIKVCSGIVTLTAGIVIVYKISKNASTNQEVSSQENIALQENSNLKKIL